MFYHRHHHCHHVSVIVIVIIIIIIIVVVVVVPSSLGTLRSNDTDDNENVKKTIGLISKTTISHVRHTFLYISFPFLHNYDVKMPNFAFHRGREQATTKFYFSFRALIWSLEIQLQEGSPKFDKVSG